MNVLMATLPSGTTCFEDIPVEVMVSCIFSYLKRDDLLSMREAIPWLSGFIPALPLARVDPWVLQHREWPITDRTQLRNRFHIVDKSELDQMEATNKAQLAHIMAHIDDWPEEAEMNELINVTFRRGQFNEVLSIYDKKGLASCRNLNLAAFQYLESKGRRIHDQPLHYQDYLDVINNRLEAICASLGSQAVITQIIVRHGKLQLLRDYLRWMTTSADSPMLIYPPSRIIRTIAHPAICVAASINRLACIPIITQFIPDAHLPISSVVDLAMHGVRRFALPFLRDSMADMYEAAQKLCCASDVTITLDNLASMMWSGSVPLPAMLAGILFRSVWTIAQSSGRSNAIIDIIHWVESNPPPRTLECHWKSNVKMLVKGYMLYFIEDDDFDVTILVAKLIRRAQQAFGTKLGSRHQRAARNFAQFCRERDID